MYPPGSGVPPSVTNFVNSCDVTAGTSTISFSCNKSIASSTCTLSIMGQTGSTPAWSDSFGGAVNARSFVVNGLANGAYTLLADNGENSTQIDFVVNCAAGAGAGVMVLDTISITQPTLAVPTGGVVFFIRGYGRRPVRYINPHGLVVAAGTVGQPGGTDTMPDMLDGRNVFRAEGIAPGATYSGTVTDSSNPARTLVVTFIIDPLPIGGCMNPAATNYNPAATVDDGSCTLPVPVPKPLFVIPLLNSLRYVVTAPDALPNLDNRHYCAEDWPGIFKLPYYQKVCRTDGTATQFQSNYTTHVAKLVDYITGLDVATLPVNTVRQNTGLYRNYSAWITAHPADVNKSRLYFHGGGLPFVFVAGDTVELVNAATAAVNGNKTVVAVTLDDVDSIPFLVLNYPYPGNAARISLNVRTTYDALPYNVLQVPCAWANIANGVYIVRITATHAVLPTVEAISEPIALQPEHPGTHLVTWRNFDDAHGLVFSNGLICGLRVESDLWEREPGGTRKVMDLPNGRILKLASTLQRRAEFVTKQLPPYLHEKIGWLFDLDYVSINLVEYVTRDAYSVDSSKVFALRNGSITVSEVGSNPQNTTDLGDVLAPGTGFIITRPNQRIQR